MEAASFYEAVAVVHDLVLVEESQLGVVEAEHDLDVSQN